MKTESSDKLVVVKEFDFSPVDHDDLAYGENQF